VTTNRDTEVYRFVAERGTTADCGHRAIEGDVLVVMVDDRVLCAECAP
jgi:hypothetical protein